MRCTSCKGFTTNIDTDPPTFDLTVVPSPGGTSAILDGFISINLRCGKCNLPKCSYDFEVQSIEVPINHKPGCDMSEYSWKVLGQERFDTHEPEHRARKYHMYGAKATIRVRCRSCRAKGRYSWTNRINLQKMDNPQTAEVSEVK